MQLDKTTEGAEEEATKADKAQQEDEAWQKFQKEFGAAGENLKEIQKSERKRMMEEAKMKKKGKQKGALLKNRRPHSDHSASAPLGLRQLLKEIGGGGGGGGESSGSSPELPRVPTSPPERRKKRLSASFTRMMMKKQPSAGELPLPNGGAGGGGGGGAGGGNISPNGNIDSPRRKAFTIGTMTKVEAEKTASEVNNAWHSLFVSPRHSPRANSGKKKDEETELSPKKLEDYERMKALFLAEALALETASDSDSDEEVTKDKQRT